MRRDARENRTDAAGHTSAAAREDGTDESERRVTARELIQACAFIVRAAWQADRRRLCGVVAVQLLTAVGMGVLVLVLRDTLGTAFSVGGKGRSAEDGLIASLCGLVVLASAGGVLRTVSSGWQRVLTVKVDRHIMAGVLRSAARSELALFEDPAFHDRLKRAVFASRSQPVVVVTALIGAVQALLSMAAVSAAFAVMAWWLLPFTALSVLPVLKAARDERNADYRLHGRLAEGRRVREYLEQLLAGQDAAKEIRALGLGDTLQDRWEGRYAEEIASTTDMQSRHTRRKAVARLLGDAVFVSVVAAMWWTVRSGGVQLPTALAATGALLMLATRVQMLGYVLNNIGASAAYMKDVRVFTADGTDTGGTRPDASSAFCHPSGFRQLRAEKLTFSYPGSAGPALREVSVELGAGEVIAVVGANGSGKSTLAKLLAGLYEPDGGRLLWDGRSVPRPAELRAASAVVFQDFVRFKMTVRDNIAFGRPGSPADPEAVAAAAADAGAGGVVAALPRGYETVLSKEFTGGADLSLGQWQRLALARAFYRDAPFVILDEPTASLDPQAEADLFRHIRRLFAGRTVLVISHRFSNVRAADRIYVMDSGRVTEHGSHEELMASDGTYARLFRLQADAYQERGDRRAREAPGGEAPRGETSGGAAAVATLP
ncbi:ABC transporter ATP-binding protein [Streptomyces marispadix]|uniref:ABC transporter ATP-binding protein/permease n=1 Tax=Streptomyces marispadix TaxID=2922868 RepID=A0ABS9T3H7_9ACTN|nr:ABC transporter ATP-binding protein [Streptomyces marispadix]MCH6163098.1 ABC transporter ATP-binding protein/permease [Streptomyces marispadix]